MPTQIEVTGKLGNLSRKIGKIGGEHITFQISHHDLEQWNRLIQFAEQEVTVVITAPQGELGLNGSGEGEEGEEGAPARRRSRKVPKDGRAEEGATA